jgi:hypothetical protein
MLVVLEQAIILTTLNNPTKNRKDEKNNYKHNLHFCIASNGELFER